MMQITNTEMVLFIILMIQTVVIIYILLRIQFIDKVMKDKLNDISNTLKDIRNDYRERPSYMMPGGYPLPPQ